MYDIATPDEWINPAFVRWLDRDSGLRDYQADATIAAILYHMYSPEPCVIVAATGAGKSHIIAGLAAYYTSAMVLQPSADLVKQNCAKGRAAGLDCSVYSAKVGTKDLTGAAIYAMPLSIKNVPDEELPHVGVLIVDEGHKSPEGAFAIAERLRKINIDLVVVMLTATPHRLGEGWIYSRRPDGTTWAEDLARNPYCDTCVYEIGAEELIAMGHLAPVVLGEYSSGLRYDTSKLVLKAGKFTAKSLAETADKVTTAKICQFMAAEVIPERGATMVFCSSVQHANEAHSLLSVAGMRSRLITAETKQIWRDEALEDLRNGDIDCVVNVAVLTTGVDVPRCATIAVLRPTESVSLYQQIVGRGMRTYPGKTECMLYDFTDNIENFFPDGNIFQPEIMSIAEKGAGEYLPCYCPTCNHENTYKAQPNKEKLPVDKQGYFCDLAGKRLECEGRPIPAHYGRRCAGIDLYGERCTFYYLGKKCRSCGCENDIAAKQCRECKHPLVDWNKKLKEAAQPPAFWRLKGGSLAARCESYVIVCGSSYTRIDFTVTGRKTELGYFATNSDLERLKEGWRPFAVEWINTGGKYPKVYIVWKESEIERRKI
ncbi:MAG: DNA or RNA helicase of superfamily II [Caudoviricetes sp.]|nr:MAG: DNA or RNA helicase of superfamily II [Caudoviricetes sp.]